MMTVEQAVAEFKTRRATYDLALAAYTAAGGMTLIGSHPAKAAFTDACLGLNAYTSDNAVKPLLKQALANGISLR